MGTMSYHRSNRLFYLATTGDFPVGVKLIAPWNEMHSVTIILKTRRTKAELHIKGFAFKVDFLLSLSSYVGSKLVIFLTPKVLAARPNLHSGMHASLWWEDSKQMDVDQVQICLKYNSATM